MQRNPKRRFAALVPAAPTAGRRRGFTLLELLISLALFSTLMALLWSLFSTYTRLAERSRLAAVEMQLLRSLGQQLRIDVDHFARMPTSPEIASVSPMPLDPTDESSPPTTPSVPAARATPTGDLPPPLLPQQFTSQLPSTTFLRGTAQRLELVTRLPYTVDVPHDGRTIGQETRYGTYQWVKYEFREPKELKTLLTEDPLLNPRNQLNPPATVNPLDPRGLPAVPQPPKRLNPNDAVGLVREAKSYLHLNRDQQREAAYQEVQAMAAQQPGGFPAPLQPRQPILPTGVARTPTSPGGLAPDPWQPPPELRAFRDHFPEVTRLQFRYLDRGTWQLTWGGGDGKLPAAIEVAFDIDADAPLQREDAFSQAHAKMMAGASLNDVLPAKPEREDAPATYAEQLDPLQTLSLKDPTAIVTEYRVVIAIGDLLASQTTETESAEMPAVETTAPLPPEARP